MESGAMAVIATLNKWSLDVERGPDWLIVRIHPGSTDYQESMKIADQIWDHLKTHFTYRLVLDMREVEMLPSHLMGQLIILQKRVAQKGGAMRLCCLQLPCQESLLLARLDAVLPNHESREEAIFGLRTVKPR